MNSHPISRKPPLNGSFPLDHDGKCKALVRSYLICLQKHKEEQTPCKDLITAYLNCRRDSGLLNPHDEQFLGLGKEKKEENEDKS